MDTNYFSVSDAQKAFNKRSLEIHKKAIRGSASPLDRARMGIRCSGVFMYVPESFVVHNGDAAYVGLRTLNIYDPFHYSGVRHGWCPVHGSSADPKTVHLGGWARPRRLSGIVHDEWVQCRKLWCSLCHDVHQQLEARVVSLCESSVDLLNECVARLKKHTWWFRAYDRRLLKQMYEIYGFPVSELKFTLANCHAALTPDLSMMIMKYCVGGNPTKLARELASYHQQNFHLELLAYVTWHLSARTNSIRNVLGQCVPPVAITAQNRHIVSAGSGLIRAFFQTLHDSSEEYQFKRRQSLVPLRFASLDHTMKTFGKMRVGDMPHLTARLTIWNSEFKIGRAHV